MFLHAGKLTQKLTAVNLEFNKPCKVFVSISDLSVPPLSKLCTQLIRFSSNQRKHGTLCEEFDEFLPTQLAQQVTVEYTHLRPNTLQVLVPKPDWNCCVCTDTPAVRKQGNSRVVVLKIHAFIRKMRQTYLAVCKVYNSKNFCTNTHTL